MLSCGTPSDGTQTGKYEFTEDWVSEKAELWADLFEPYKDRPDVRYLEIGLYEGRSLIWMLDNVLTDPSSSATGIELRVSDRLLGNIEKSGRARRVEALEGTSQIRLRELPYDSFDIIYIDGSHIADDVLSDEVQSWPLLRVGGTMIFDDYRWKGAEYTDGRPLPAELLPEPAIDAFLFA